MSEEGLKQRNIRPFVIAFGVIGIILLAIDEVQIGLTIIAVAGLLSFGVFILERLRRIGAESWAIGSIIVGLGYTFLTVVPIGFAWDFLSLNQEIILSVAAIIFMILGYTMEYYDLNERFLIFLSKAKFQFQKIMHDIKEGFFRSVWTTLAALLIIYTLSSYFLPILLYPIELSFPNLPARLILILVAILFLIIEFRQIFTFFILRAGELLILLIQGIGRRFRQLKGLLSAFFRNLQESLKRFYSLLKNSVLFVINNTYTFGILSLLVIGLIALIRDDIVLGHLTVIILITTLGLFLYQYDSQLEHRIQLAQLKIYNSSFSLRRVFRRTRRVNCPNCNAEQLSINNVCTNCRFQLLKCMICRDVIDDSSKSINCNHCQNNFHYNHINSWIKINPTCPVCKEVWIDEVSSL